jgi:hypothetical protein
LDFSQQVAIEAGEELARAHRLTFLGQQGAYFTANLGDHRSLAIGLERRGAGIDGEHFGAHGGAHFHGDGNGLGRFVIRRLAVGLVAAAAEGPRGDQSGHPDPLRLHGASRQRARTWP